MREDVLAQLTSTLAAQDAILGDIKLKPPQQMTRPSLGAMQQKNYVHGQNPMGTVGGVPPHVGAPPQNAPQRRNMPPPPPQGSGMPPQAGMPPSFPYQSAEARNLLEQTKSGHPDSMGNINVRERALAIERAFQSQQKSILDAAAQLESDEREDISYKMLEGVVPENQRKEMSRAAGVDPKAFAKINEEMAKRTGGTNDQRNIDHLSVLDPEMGAKEKADTFRKMIVPYPPAGTTVNVGTQSEMPKLGVGEVPVDPERYWDTDLPTVERLKGGTELLKDQQKKIDRRLDTLQKASQVTKHVSNIRDTVKNQGFIKGTGGGGQAIRMISDFLDPPKKEGDTNRFRWTDAGEIDAQLEPIKTIIGLQTIGQMRQMSESGGALGNVSNFEVRMVQASIDALDPNRGEEYFLRALDNVDMAFKRAGYLIQNMEDLRAKARELGVDEARFVQDQLNKKFPINAEFMEQIKLQPH